MKRWRLIENEWNLRGKPWRDAVGIEEIDEDQAVPAVICWFTRGNEEQARRVVELYNSAISNVV